MESKAQEFWQNCEKYHDLAKKFERNIEIQYPSGASCICGNNCPWAATKVKYPSYNGPRVSRL